jgi:hypothetical protein
MLVEAEVKIIESLPNDVKQSRLLLIFFLIATTIIHGNGKANMNFIYNLIQTQ